jgi:hypothetical protein
VRLRLLVPGRRRGRGLRRLSRGRAAAVAVALLLVCGCGGGDGPRRPTPAPAPTAAPVREPALAVGITEPNPGFFRTAADPALSRWRDALVAIRPAHYRLVVDWARLQPAAGTPADLDLTEAGCARRAGPCVPWAGVRDQLRALAGRQRDGGWEALVVVTDTPAWAAAPGAACAEGGGGPRSAAVRADALPAYRALIDALLAAGRETGARLRWWSPWNEPNHPYFAPQRTACDASAPTRAVAAYVPLARTLQSALDAAPGDQGLALGELAGVRAPTARATGIGEFVAALPRDVVCAAGVWTQHAYIGGADPVGLVTAALRARSCPGGVPPIWITETGVGAPDSRLSIARGIPDEGAGCRALHARLVRWWRDPRVAAAFQYTLREDPLFPTGLVSADLAAGRQALAEWQAWGDRARPDDPPPAPACST